MAWQTFVVIILGTATFTIAQVLGNVEVLGLKDKPWLVTVVLPSVLTLIGLAQNQLKSIGAPPPGTARTVTETTTVPPKP